MTVRRRRYETTRAERHNVTTGAVTQIRCSRPASPTSKAYDTAQPRRTPAPWRAPP
jgi:hypothetical protein